MKTILNILIVGMFGVEVCSPFMIGYLDKKHKQIKASNEFYNKRNKNTNSDSNVAEAAKSSGWKTVDYSTDNYSDSKTLVVKE